MSSPGNHRRRSWPAVNEDTEYFWFGLVQGELRIQKCLSCSTLSHPPKPHCPVCGSFELGHQAARGGGAVYSYVTFHKPLSPGFEEPYNVSLVELDEGVRVVSQVVGIAPDAVSIGMRVQLVIKEVEPGLMLPLFTPATHAE